MAVRQGALEGVVKDFWRGRRVFLTGHTGFKGGWLALWLQKLGATVTGYSLPPSTNPSLFELARIADGMRSIIGDINRLADLQRAMERAQPEVVMHLAAQPLVHGGYDEPVSTYMTNVMGTVHLLEAVRGTPGVRAVVVVTTDKCYENRDLVTAFREDDRLGGYDPYSNSKACAELVAAAYRSSYFNPNRHQEHGIAVATARAGNVIGGGDWNKDRLVPDVLRAIEAGTPAAIRHPHAVRPWQHVLEPLHGYLILAERLCSEGAAFAEGWNFGLPDEDATTVEWIVEQLTRRWPHALGWKPDGLTRPPEAQHLKLDCSKARARLGWAPRLSLDNTIDWIVDWHREHSRKGDMRAVSERQLEAFEKLAAP